MADYGDEIDAQSAGPFTRDERQGLRLILERFIWRERFKVLVKRWLGWATAALAVAGGTITVLKFWKGGL